MQHTIVVPTIQTMGCGTTLTSAILAVPGVIYVHADPSKKEITIDYNDENFEQIQQSIIKAIEGTGHAFQLPEEGIADDKSSEQRTYNPYFFSSNLKLDPQSGNFYCFKTHFVCQGCVDTLRQCLNVLWTNGLVLNCSIDFTDQAFSVVLAQQVPLEDFQAAINQCGIVTELQQDTQQLDFILQPTKKRPAW